MSTEKQKKPPIAIFTHEFYPKKGGIATFVEAMATEAALCGHEVTLYAPYFSDSAKKFPFAISCLRHKGTQSWSSRIVTAWSMLKNRKKLQESIVYLPEPGPIRLFIYFNLFRLIKPHKLVLTLHGSDIYLLSKYRYRKFLFNKLLENVDRVTVLSRYTFNLAQSLFCESKGKLYYTPGALRLGFKPVAKCLAPRNMFNLLTVARIHPRKGHIDVLQAISRLELSLKNQVNYQVLGPTVRPLYRKKIEKYAKQNQISLEFLDEVPDATLPQAYSRADVFVMASQRYKDSIEGFGLAFLEASASSLPVICYDSGGVADAVEANETGILVPFGDIDALTSAIQRLILSPELRKKMGQKGQVKASSNTWQHNVEVAFS